MTSPRFADLHQASRGGRELSLEAGLEAVEQLPQAAAPWSMPGKRLMAGGMQKAANAITLRDYPN